MRLTLEQLESLVLELEGRVEKLEKLEQKQPAISILDGYPTQSTSVPSL